MWKVEVSIEIDRPPAVIWPVLTDVARWPEWTASVNKVERLDHLSFGVGSSVRIDQPKLKTTVWRVTEFEQGGHFTWVTQSLGVFTVARHVVQSTARGSMVTLVIEQKGWLAPVLKPIFENLTRQYMTMEANGLKRRCEASIV